MLSGLGGAQLPREAILTLQPVSLLQEIPPELWGILNHLQHGPHVRGPVQVFTWAGLMPWLGSSDYLTPLGVYHNAERAAGAGNCVSDRPICTETGKRPGQDGRRLERETQPLAVLELTFSSTAELSPLPAPERRGSSTPAGRMVGKGRLGLLTPYPGVCEISRACKARGATTHPSCCACALRSRQPI